MLRRFPAAPCRRAWWSIVALLAVGAGLAPAALAQVSVGPMEFRLFYVPALEQPAPTPEEDGNGVRAPASGPDPGAMDDARAGAGEAADQTAHAVGNASEALDLLAGQAPEDGAQPPPPGKDPAIAPEAKPRAGVADAVPVDGEEGLATAGEDGGEPSGPRQPPAPQQDDGGRGSLPSPSTEGPSPRAEGMRWAILAGAAVATTRAAGGLLARLWAWLCGLPLFSRRVGRALEHPVRQRVHAELSRSPGIVFSDLARRVALRPGHLEYHLRVLARDGLAFKVRSPGFACYFADAAQARSLAQGPPALRCPRAQRILRLVREGFASTRSLAQATGLSREAVRFHLRRLARSRLVALDGGTVRPAAAGQG